MIDNTSNIERMGFISKYTTNFPLKPKHRDLILRQ